MKNASLVLNVVLLLAVAVLFYLHFSSKKTTDTPKVASSQIRNSETAPAGDFRIAYFEMDSLNNSFAMVKDVKAELSREEEKVNNELARLQKSYNDKFTQYQSQAQTMSSQESENANRDIVQMQQKFASAKQQMEMRLQDLSMRKMQEVKNKVEEFLKEYNKSKGYTYILAYEPGFMFYRDSAYDITADLVKGLN
ncbi:MAG: OmpH family outer membrane protein, partial [Sphingobacteriales bacterium]